MKILSVREMRRLESLAIANGVSGYELMENAGINAADCILEQTQRCDERHCRRFMVFAGKGNNGGDAWVTARRLFSRGCNVKVLTTCQPDMLGEDARGHAKNLPCDCPIELCQSGEDVKAQLREGDVIIDGLLGTGVHGEVRGMYRDIIAAINASNRPVFSLDVPSGLDADTGEGTCAVRADWTVTMGFPKKGLLEKEGVRLSGTVRIVDIGLPEDIAANAAGEDKEAFTEADAAFMLCRRDPSGHKNTFGHLLCLCNSIDYSGAGYLCASSALRTGAGLVTLAVPGDSQRREGPAALIQRQLPGHCFSESHIDILPELLAGKTALVYGPGTGRNADSGFLRALLESRIPLLIDADGLRLLASSRSCQEKLHGQVVLTPHPGEMSALLTGFGLETLRMCTRCDQARGLAMKAGCTVVLKGRFTIVADSSEMVTMNLSGDVSLATAGSGDVLAGCIGAFLAEGHDVADAARLGVFMHGLAAELRTTAARSLIADDLPDSIGLAFRHIAPWL